MNHNCRPQYEIDIYGVPPKIGQYILSFGWLLTKIRFSANHHWYFCFNDTVHDITAILLLCCMQHACTCTSCGNCAETKYLSYLYPELNCLFKPDDLALVPGAVPGTPAP